MEQIRVATQPERIDHFMRTFIPDIIWLNTPTRPLEASGTSGEKALMNGVVNFSVLDGWWLEGYREGAGWALTEKRTYQNQEHQDQLDAATIYSILETEILPLYYARNKKGYSEGWIKVERFDRFGCIGQNGRN